MTFTPPTFSVIVPVFNGAGTLVRCLESLRALAEPAPLEIIVVDDASTDESAEIAARLATRVIRLTEESGPSVARNAGAAAARGEYLAFTDSDCVVPPDWLARLLAALATGRYAGVTGPYSGAATNELLPRLMDEALRYAQRLMPPDLESSISSNLAMKREDFLAVGGFPVYRLPGETRPYFGNEDEEFAIELRRHTGKYLRWLPTAGVRHAYRDSWRGFWRQQKRYTEAIMVSVWRDPALFFTKSNYSRTGGSSRVLALVLALMSLSLAARRSRRWAAGLLPFLLLHAGEFAWIAGRARDRRERGAFLTAALPFFIWRELAWTLGLSTGFLKGMRARGARLSRP